MPKEPWQDGGPLDGFYDASNQGVKEVVRKNRLKSLNESFGVQQIPEYGYGIITDSPWNTIESIVNRLGTKWGIKQYAKVFDMFESQDQGWKSGVVGTKQISSVLEEVYSQYKGGINTKITQPETRRVVTKIMLDRDSNARYKYYLHKYEGNVSALKILCPLVDEGRYRDVSCVEIEESMKGF